MVEIQIHGQPLTRCHFYNHLYSWKSIQLHCWNGAMSKNKKGISMVYVRICYLDWPYHFNSVMWTRNIKKLNPDLDNGGPLILLTFSATDEHCKCLHQKPIASKWNKPAYIILENNKFHMSFMGHTNNNFNKCSMF